LEAGGAYGDGDGKRAEGHEKSYNGRTQYPSPSQAGPAIPSSGRQSQTSNSRAQDHHQLAKIDQLRIGRRH
jgi:hypothetical protein